MKLPVEMSDPNTPSPTNRSLNSEPIRRINTRTVDYSEYMWMGEEMEEFDQQCLEEFLEEEFISQCFEEMLEEEDEVYDLVQWMCDEYEDVDPQVVMECLQDLALDNNIELTFLQDPTACRRQQRQQQTTHKLNPNAPEFIPLSHRNSTTEPPHQEALSYDSPPRDR